MTVMPILEAPGACTARRVRNPVREAMILSTKGILEQARSSAVESHFDLSVQHPDAAGSGDLP